MNNTRDQVISNEAKMKIKIGQMRRLLPLAWCKETATNEDWDENNPSLNQCAVTALLVQDELGGDLLRCEMTNGDSHYWNRVGNYEIDLTAEQFDRIEPQPLKDTAVVRNRSYVLDPERFQNTINRYEILRKRYDVLRILE